jgi:hypothetical protein
LKKVLETLLYMFQAVSPPIIRISKLYTHTQHDAVKLAFCYREREQQASLARTRCCMYSFELLMMGGETA